jgi:hypothetical protein
MESEAVLICLLVFFQYLNRLGDFIAVVEQPLSSRQLSLAADGLPRDMAVDG